MTKRTRNLPTITWARLIKRIAIPPLFISVPAKMKKGIANRAKLSSPLANRCETVIAAISQGNINSIEATVAIAIENEMGTPIKTSTKNSQTV